MGHKESHLETERTETVQDRGEDIGRALQIWPL